jgi:hypothetical protein
MTARRFSGRLDVKFNPFEDDYLAQILQAAAIAWTLIKQPSGTEIEDRITFRLAGRLLHDPHFAQIPYDIVPQYWLLGLNGQRLGRLDIRFKHRHSQSDYFAFESKRLHVRYPGGKFKTEYSTYSGQEGMMAFVKGQYSKGLPAAGMLGYVMDGKSSRAWIGLEKRIHLRRNRLKLAKNSKFATSAMSSSIAASMRGTYLGETHHDLKAHHLRLFHLLLPVV